MLAAGASSRYGDAPPKQAIFLPRVLDSLARARTLAGVLVVAGAHPLDTDARVVRAEEWALGPGASLRAGLAALPADADAALVVLADGPDLDPRAVDRVVESWQGEDAAAATYAGVRLHPVLLARRVWAAVPDEGARSLPARAIPCDDLPPPGDVDVLG